jgi:mannose-6-phosphate isomerase
MQVCPLVFRPIFKPKIWGAQNLSRLLGKSLPPDEAIGESWECADLKACQSVVVRGPAQGQALHELVQNWGSALLGRAEAVDGRFPLLIKFLDAAEDLSIQVHPDPETARRLGGEVRVKHEAWYVIDAAEGAAIYRGLKPGATVEALGKSMAERPESILDYLEKIPVRAGAMYFLPSGTLHALGAGVVVAEIQTPSDITYRLYDWGRVRPESDAGLHVQQGLACIRADIDFAPFEKHSHVSSVFTTVTRLVTCPSFTVEKVRFIGQVEQEIPSGGVACWIVLEGRGQIHYGKTGLETFEKGEVIILPAGLERSRLETLTDCQWLEVTIPTPSDLAAYPRPDSAQLRALGRPDDRPVQLNIDLDHREAEQ